MRFAVLAAALTLSTTALADQPSDHARWDFRPTFVCGNRDPMGRVSKLTDTTRPQLPTLVAFQRSKHVKAELERTDDHLLEAAERRATASTAARIARDMLRLSHE